MLVSNLFVHKNAVHSVIIVGFRRRLYQMTDGPYRIREDTREKIHGAGGLVEVLKVNFSVEKKHHSINSFRDGQRVATSLSLSLSTHPSIAPPCSPPQLCL